MGLHVLVILAIAPRQPADELHDQDKEDEGKQRQKPNPDWKGDERPAFEVDNRLWLLQMAKIQDGQESTNVATHGAPGEQLLMLIFIGFIDGQKSVVEDQRCEAGEPENQAQKEPPALLWSFPMLMLLWKNQPVVFRKLGTLI